MNELRPCPFCGGKAHIMRGGHWIACEDCQSESGYCSTKEEAIEAWNRRVDNAAMCAGGQADERNNGADKG